jgi:hypothetical protein
VFDIGCVEGDVAGRGADGLGAVDDGAVGVFGPETVADLWVGLEGDRFSVSGLGEYEVPRRFRHVGADFEQQRRLNPIDDAVEQLHQRFGACGGLCRRVGVFPGLVRKRAEFECELFPVKEGEGLRAHGHVTTGSRFIHSVIPAETAALQRIGASAGLKVETRRSGCISCRRRPLPSRTTML